MDNNSENQKEYLPSEISYSSVYIPKQSDSFAKKKFGQLANMRCDHIVRIVKGETNGQILKSYFIEEEGIKLSDLINKKYEFTQTEIKIILVQLIKVFLYCQKQQIIHGRMCPQHIILHPNFKHYSFQSNSKNFFVKVFNFSLAMEDKQRIKNQPFFPYMFPSLYIHEPGLFRYYHPSLDMWSIGLILYEMVYYTNPFVKKGKLSRQMVENYCQKKQELPLYNQAYRHINQYIKQLLSNDKKNSWKKFQLLFLERELKFAQIDFEFKMQLFNEHCNLMIFFSLIFSFTNENLVHNPHDFWVLYSDQIDKILLFISKLMKQLNDRYKKFYENRFFMLEQNRVKNFKRMEKAINQQNKLVDEKLQNKLSLKQTVKKIDFICAQIQMGISEFENQSRNYSSESERQKRDSLHKKWKSVTIMKDFCMQLKRITNLSLQNDNLRRIYSDPYYSVQFKRLFYELSGKKW